jgi:hypothetical protein
MVNRFAPAQPMGLIRKAILIAVATLALMLLWASIAISAGGDPYYEMGPDGMMRPDGTIIQGGGGPVQRPGPTPGPSAPPIHLNFRAATTQSNQSNQSNQSDQSSTFTYKSSHQANGSWLITRNGAKWLTVAARSGYFEITDPNGTRNMVIKLDQTQRVQPNTSRSTH